jgi:hypothetical protein
MRPHYRAEPRAELRREPITRPHCRADGLARGSRTSNRTSVRTIACHPTNLQAFWWYAVRLAVSHQKSVFRRNIKRYLFGSRFSSIMWTHDRFAARFGSIMWTRLSIRSTYVQSTRLLIDKKEWSEKKCLKSISDYGYGTLKIPNIITVKKNAYLYLQSYF